MNARNKVVEELLFGANVVLSALQANKRNFIKAFLPLETRIESNVRRPPLREELSKIQELLKAKNIPIEYKFKYEMDELAASRPHNGVLMKATTLSFPSISHLDIINEDEYKIKLKSGAMMKFPLIPERKRPPLFVYLDSLWDPHNVGAILRTCLYLGVDGIIYPDRGTSSLTGMVNKASSGALEWIPLFYISNGHKFLENSKKKGWFIRMTHKPPTLSPTSSPSCSPSSSSFSPPAIPPLSKPSILILGNEYNGVAHQFHKWVDAYDWIPSQLPGSHVWSDSLNVSVAAGIVLHRLLSLHRKN